MAQSGKGRLNYRCPSCFLRDLDIDMFYDAEKNEYYCIRCCFHGPEAKVLEWNELCKLRYGQVAGRLEEIGGDTEVLKFHPYQKGEL